VRLPPIPIRPCGPCRLAVRPAALALRAEVVAGRAGASVVHRVAASAGASPHAGPASFRDLSDQAVGFADGRRHDGGTGGCCDADGQRSAQNDRLHHVAAFSRIEAKPNSLQVRNRRGCEATNGACKSNGISMAECGLQLGRSNCHKRPVHAVSATQVGGDVAPTRPRPKAGAAVAILRPDRRASPRLSPASTGRLGCSSAGSASTDNAGRFLRQTAGNRRVTRHDGPRA
jgi:hypothetical protein